MTLTVSPQLQDVLDGIVKLATVDPHLLPEPGLLAHTEAVFDALDQLNGVAARAVQVIDVRQATVAEYGHHTKSWLAQELRLSAAEASKRVQVARALPVYPVMGAALVAGEINHDHAKIIKNCLRALPADWAEAAEAELVEAARSVNPDALAQLCAELRLRTGADEDAEAAAQRKFASRWATATATFDGMLHLEAMLDPEAAAVITAAIEPYLTGTSEDDRTLTQRRADALHELALFSLRHGDLPDVGGHRPGVIVTIGLDELSQALQARQAATATLNGWDISPETARRLACDAGIIPAIMNSTSEVLDLGRSTPVWNRAQRRAAALRDKHCGFPGCTAHLRRCQLHHLTWWIRGGRTDLANSVYLCLFHHQLIHHRSWTITRTKTGLIEVHKT